MIFPGLEFSGFAIVVGFLIPLLGQAAKFIAPIVGRIFGGGSAATVAAPAARAIIPAAQRLIQQPIRALAPTVRRALPVLTKGVGIAGAGAAFEAGARAVGGQRGLTVRIGRDGQPEVVRRRRINPTNIRALRRAARRIRSFQRATRKVARLVGGGRRVHVHALPRRRRTWRGDILPFEHNGAINPYAAEDYADYLDEAEDLGFDPRFFQDEEAAED